MAAAAAAAAGAGEAAGAEDGAAADSADASAGGGGGGGGAVAGEGEGGPEGGGGGGAGAAGSNLVTVRVHNIVSTISVGITLDLAKIAHNTRNAEYSPKRFSGLIMKIRDPKATALVFSTGKIIITGVSDMPASKRAARRFCAILKHLGLKPKLADFKVRNMTATVNVGFPVRLEGFAYKHHASSTYEPELFPGLCYKMQDPKCTALIFVSGKIVITGAQSKDLIGAAVHKLLPMLAVFRKESVLVARAAATGGVAGGTAAAAAATGR